MKTIKEQIFGESIISNTAGIGIRARVEEWAKKAFWSTSNFKINDDNSVDILFKDALLNVNVAVIPTRINECINLTIESDKVQSFVLPRQANKVLINECKNLKTLKVDEDSNCGELIIKNCPLLDFDNETIGMLKSSFNKITIENCGITTVYCLGYVHKTVSIDSCKDLKKWDATELDAEYLDIQNSNIKEFDIKTNIEVININNCKFLSKLIIDNAKKNFKLYVSNCSRLKDVTVCNDAADIVIGDCGVNKISIANCSNLFNVAKLDNVEYTLPDTISGTCIFKKCKNVPDNINCKKLIVKD